MSRRNQLINLILEFLIRYLEMLTAHNAESVAVNPHLFDLDAPIGPYAYTGHWSSRASNTISIYSQINSLFEQAQTASMNEASSNSNSTSSYPKASEYESPLEQLRYPLNEVPAEYKCELMDEVMVDPVYDPKAPHIKFDRKNICHHLASTQTNPYTNQPLKPDELVPDEELKIKIDFFIKKTRTALTLTSQPKLTASPIDKDERYYNILALEYGANKAEIRQAYLKKIKQAHPDRSIKSKNEANKTFTEITQAYKYLMKQYDENAAINRTVTASPNTPQIGFFHTTIDDSSESNNQIAYLYNESPVLNG